MLWEKRHTWTIPFPVAGMEEDSIGAAATPPKEAVAAGKVEEGVIKNSQNAAKHGRYDRCFSFVEISIDPGVKSLKQLDSKKFKEDIKKWAKRVAAYARQFSDRFGSSRR